MNRSFIRILIAPIMFASCAGSAMAADCAPPTLLNSVAMEQMPGSDIMTVPVTIEGQSAKLMIGIADGSQLWSAQAQKLDLPVREGPRMMDGGGRFSEDTARVGSLTLGSMETGNFFTQVGTDPEFTGSDGVLGTDMMMRYDIDLDFAHGKLNYFTPEQCQGAGVYWAPGKITAVKMAAYADVVFVPVNLDGHMIIAALDTTADKTFLNPNVAQKLFGLKPGSLAPGKVRDSGAVMQAGMRRFSSLSFGGLTFDNPEIAIPFDIQSQNTREFHAARTARDSFHLSEFLPDMIIGMDVLKQTHLYISFRDQRVYVSPAGDGQALTATPVKTSWFNVWRHGYDTYLYPGRRPFFSL
ncbi:MAG TPA: retropepsin-like aspartic protease [Rhizomicrobium sp.]|nr:retropepsin-like aspartic protease [Rhizomicrobium sp.]